MKSGRWLAVPLFVAAVAAVLLGPLVTGHYSGRAPRVWIVAVVVLPILSLFTALVGAPGRFGTWRRWCVAAVVSCAVIVGAVRASLVLFG